MQTGPDKASKAILKRSYTSCRQITKDASSNFYLASRLFDLDTRRGIRALYAYCRVIDDIADSTKLTPAQKNRALESIEKSLKAGEPARYAKEIWPAVYDTIQHHKLPLSEILEVLEGVKSDVEFVQPRTLTELDQYSYKVAGVVGVLSARILGAFKRQTLQGAKELGIAMQYINVIRDVDTDLARGRIYIPESVMKEAHLNAADLQTNANPAGRIRALSRLAERAETYIAQAKPSVADLHSSYQGAVRVAMALYQALLDRIKQKQYTKGTGRVSLRRREKLALAITAYRA